MQAITAIIFLAALGAVTLAGGLPPIVLVLYVAASAATFILYARDKVAAERNQWRTRESILHAFGIAGGWPGALIAQTMLRHKSKKRPFRYVLWMTVILNCGAMFLYFFPGQFIAMR